MDSRISVDVDIVTQFMAVEETFPQRGEREVGICKKEKSNLGFRV